MKKRVLIVDDHSDFRMTIKDYLHKKELGLEIFEAATGEMGVAKASFVKPHVVLMDINLPDINGLEAAKHIKKEYPQAEIIILTVFDVGTFKRSSERIKVRDFIAKHDVHDRLVPAIKACLSKKSVKRSRI